MSGTAEDRFFSKILVHISGPHRGCWEWLGAKSRGGDRRFTYTGETRPLYGKFKVNGISYRAHRWAYEHFLGKRVSRRLDLDHAACDWSLCVNPAHLVPCAPALNRGRRRRAA